VYSGILYSVYIVPVMCDALYTSVPTICFIHLVIIVQ